MYQKVVLHSQVVFTITEAYEFSEYWDIKVICYHIPTWLQIWDIFWQDQKLNIYDDDKVAKWYLYHSRLVGLYFSPIPFTSLPVSYLISSVINSTGLEHDQVRQNSRYWFLGLIEVRLAQLSIFTSKTLSSLDRGYHAFFYRLANLGAYWPSMHKCGVRLMDINFL